MENIPSAQIAEASSDVRYPMNPFANPFIDRYSDLEKGTEPCLHSESELKIKAETMDVSAIETMHHASGNDGYIGFMMKSKSTGGRAINLCSIPVEDIRRHRPTIAKFLETDFYMTVNSYYRPAPYSNKITGLLDVVRAEKNLRYLTACYVDLDVGRPDDPKAERRITDVDALAKVFDMVSDGLIPPPSMYAHSGRGIYLLWFLRGDDGKLQKAFLSDRKFYKRINKELCRRLEHLGADSVAHDCARILRVPGSKHTKSGKVVKYVLPATGGVTYTLKSLAEFLKLPLHEDNGKTEILPKMRIAVKPGSCPNRRKGVIAKAKMRYEDVLKIENFLGGFPYGMRKRSLQYVAEFMRLAGYPRFDAERIVHRMALNSKPPFSGSNDMSLSELFRKVYKGKAGFHPNIKNSVLAKFFRVTDAMVKFYDQKGTPLVSIVPDNVRKARKGISKRESVELRRKNILKIIQDQDALPSIRRLTHLLNNAYELHVSKTTVARDMAQLAKDGSLLNWKDGQPDRPILMSLQESA